MQTSNLSEIIFYKDKLILSNTDVHFSDFINGLTEVELSGYLYIEAKRVECFLNELGLNNSDNNAKNDMLHHHAIKSQDNFLFLIKFVNDCANFPKPDLKTILSLISKHETYIRKLTELEKKFFHEC